MSDIAIEVQGLGKRYRIGTRRRAYRTLRESLNDVVAAPLRGVRSASARGNVQRVSEDFWALKDISFEVKRGEVVGIIGRNGAGKSTLLKILSRITEPSEGSVDLYGRVGSLLEVGTGFHPELTGRENIYLNGAILGMRRADIERKFDEIVAFAEVEQFIDTPVKHYSSGMYVRLAFAVAAHLEPEILLIDEVLAVGDVEFQKKCLGKMDSVAREGRTVLVVSHNMETILSLCSQAFVLQGGRVGFGGNTEEAVQLYLGKSTNETGSRAPHVLYDGCLEASTDGAQAEVVRIELLDNAGNPKVSVYTWDDLVLRVHYRSDREVEHGSVILDLCDGTERRLTVLDSGLRIPIRRGYHHVDCHLSRLPLAGGEYYLGAGLALSNSGWLWRRRNIAVLRVHGRDVYCIGRPIVSSRMVFAAEHTWSDEE